MCPWKFKGNNKTTLLRKSPLNLEDKIQKALIEKDYSKFQAEISNNGFLKYLPEFSTTYFLIRAF